MSEYLKDAFSPEALSSAAVYAKGAALKKNPTAQEVVDALAVVYPSHVNEVPCTRRLVVISESFYDTLSDDSVLLLRRFKTYGGLLVSSFECKESDLEFPVDVAWPDNWIKFTVDYQAGFNTYKPDSTDKVLNHAFDRLKVARTWFCNCDRFRNSDPENESDLVCDDCKPPETFSTSAVYTLLVKKPQAYSAFMEAVSGTGYNLGGALRQLLDSVGTPALGFSWVAPVLKPVLPAAPLRPPNRFKYQDVDSYCCSSCGGDCRESGNDCCIKGMAAIVLAKPRGGYRLPVDARSFRVTFYAMIMASEAANAHVPSGGLKSFYVMAPQVLSFRTTVRSRGARHFHDTLFIHGAEELSVEREANLRWAISIGLSRLCMAKHVYTHHAEAVIATCSDPDTRVIGLSRADDVAVDALRRAGFLIVICNGVRATCSICGDDAVFQEQDDQIKCGCREISPMSRRLEPGEVPAFLAARPKLAVLNPKCFAAFQLHLERLGLPLDTAHGGVGLAGSLRDAEEHFVYVTKSGSPVTIGESPVARFYQLMRGSSNSVPFNGLLYPLACLALMDGTAPSWFVALFSLLLRNRREGIIVIAAFSKIRRYRRPTTLALLAQLAVGPLSPMILFSESISKLLLGR